MLKVGKLLGLAAHLRQYRAEQHGGVHREQGILRTDENRGGRVIIRTVRGWRRLSKTGPNHAVVDLRR